MDPNRNADGRASEAMHQRLQDMRIVEPWQNPGQNGQQRVMVHPNSSLDWRAREALRQRLQELWPVQPGQNRQQRVIDHILEQFSELDTSLPFDTANLHQGEADLNFPIELVATDPLEEAMRYVVPLNAASVSQSLPAHNSAVSFTGLNHDTVYVGSLVRSLDFHGMRSNVHRPDLPYVRVWSTQGNEGIHRLPVDVSNPHPVIANPHPVNGRPVDGDFDRQVCITVEALRLLHNAGTLVQPSIATSSRSSRDPGTGIPYQPSPLETVTLPSLSTRDR